VRRRNAPQVSAPAYSMAVGPTSLSERNRIHPSRPNDSIKTRSGQLASGAARPTAGRRSTIESTRRMQFLTESPGSRDRSFVGVGDILVEDAFLGGHRLDVRPRVLER
jgi:hypothetical protein